MRVTMSAVLYDKCVYTIIDEDRLLAADRGNAPSKELLENGSWTRVKEWLADAASSDVRVPIIFADAKDVHRWLGWAMLVDVEIAKDGESSRAKTKFILEQLRPPFAEKRSALRLANTGVALSDGHIRPYVLFETPEFLRALAATSGEHLQSWLGTPAAIDYAILHSGEPRDQQSALKALNLAVGTLQAAVPKQWEALVTPGRIRLYVGGERDKDHVIFNMDRDGWTYFLIESESNVESDGPSNLEPRPEGLDVDHFAEFESELDGFISLARAWASSEKDLTPHTSLLLDYCTQAPPNADVEGELDIAVREGLDELWTSWDHSAVEGNLVLVHHLRRERSSQLVKEKRNELMRTQGYVACEACGFRPDLSFPNLVREFCEVHHTKPLGEAASEVTTRLEDLAVLCPNCHRAVHALSELPTVEEFRMKYFPNRAGHGD